MSHSLFRQQVLDERRSRLYGVVILNQPPALIMITLLILLIVICAGILLFNGSYARRESVSGYLVPDKGLVKIYATAKGILSKQFISEGASVSIDEPLFSISTVQSSEANMDKDGLKLVELERQKSSLNEKVRTEFGLYQGKTAAINSQMEGLNHELSKVTAAVSLLEQQMNISREKFLKLKKLYQRGHVSESQLQEAEQQHLGVKIRLQTTHQHSRQLENQLNILDQKLAQLPLQWESQRADLNYRMSEINQMILEISSRRQYSIRAPVSGRLTALQITEGQAVSAASPLVSILPEGSKLQAELFLPTRAAGFIEHGQKVQLKYEAFPYQHYGLQEGWVSEITEVILTPSELPIPLPIKEPVYRVRVAIEEQFVKAMGKNFPLQAGMLLSAVIVLEQRTMAQWLLEPIYSMSKVL